MEHKKRKHILYSICFVFLGLVDWARGSLPWVYFATAINLIGCFMAIIMMSHFSWREEAKKPYLIWLGVGTVGSLVGYLIWRNNPGTVFLSQYCAVALSVLLIGIVAVRVLRERKQLVGQYSWKSIFLWCWIVMSVLMNCSRMGEIWPLWYVMIFGLFYLIPFSEEERTGLWNGLADGLIVVFFLLQIFAYGFRPYDMLRYNGAYVNCNMNALFYLVTYIALLYRMHGLRWQEKQEGGAVTWKRRLAWFLLWILTVGIWGFVLLTMTRTALIMLVALTVVYFILEFFVIFPEKIWRVLLRVITFCIGVVVIFPAVYLTVRYLPTILHHPIWFEGEYSIYKVHSFDPSDSNKYIDVEEMLGELLNRLGVEIPEKSPEARIANTEFPLLASVDFSVETDYLLTGDDVYSASASRLRIWELYLKNLNFAGHELEEGYFQITASYHAWHAQNVFIQVAFYYGIIPGILFVVLMIGMGIRAIQLAFCKRRCEDILPLMAGLLFVGYGMLECVWYPGQVVLLLIYLIPKIMIDNKREVND